MTPDILATGWVDFPEAVAETCAAMGIQPLYAAAPALFVDPAEAAAFLWKAEEKLRGVKSLPWDQNPVGSCVGFGWTRAAQDCMFVEIASGEPEEYPGADLAPEVTYGGSRVEVGGGRIRGDGSVGAWAAKWVVDWGVVPRGVYGNLDLTKYDPDTCRMLGSRGVPDQVEQVARQHPVTTVAKVTSGQEGWAALMAGKPIAVCSNRGFSMRIDADGFCAPQGVWQHCYPAGTLVDGPETRPIEKVLVGDLVYGHDGHTHPVTEIMRRPYRGNLARVTTRGGGTHVSTEDHPVLVYRKVPARFLVAQTAGYVDRVEATEYRQSEKTPRYVPAWVMAKDIRPGDFLASPRVKPVAEVDPETGWMYGFYAGDGSAMHNGIQFTLGKRKPLDRLCEAIRKLGHKPVVKDCGTYSRVSVYDRGLGRQFAAWFGKSSGRRLPPHLLHQSVLEGLLDADGCEYKGRRIHSTISPVLARQVRSLVVAAGERPSCHTKTPGRGTYANGKVQHVTEWTPGNRSNYHPEFCLYKVVSNLLVPFDGDVFNIEVDEVHSYVADGFATHNCMEFVGAFTHPTRGPSVPVRNSWADYLNAGFRTVRYVKADGTEGTFELPPGCFCTTLGVAGDMLAQGDSYALAGLKGWEKMKVDWTP